VSVRGAIGVVILLVASIAAAAPAPAPAPGPSFWPAPPGLRLPEGVTPLAYDLRLEVNPDDPTFRGRVEITTKLSARTDVIWLHAVGLELTSVAFREGAYTGSVRTVPGTEEMIGLRLERPAGPGEITLVFAYTGSLTSSSEGLFRQTSGGRWFVYSQSESVFARRFVPCFDEPRFKPAWRVTLVVPGDQVALANAPVARTQRLADGRREVTFAELGPMPSYLLALAVGPFALVDAGTVGRSKIPVRIAVPREDARRLTLARRTLPVVVAALERYMDRPLPWPKLDLVAVPMFFGAMENIGLVTFTRGFLVDDGPPEKQRALFIRIAAHELAHQWFGNTVTHTWWDELWLTESVTELVADHVARELGVLFDGGVTSELDDVLLGDGRPPPRALRQPIMVTADIEDTFGATAYTQGRRVLATFEQLVGPPAMRDALRAYVSSRAGGSVTVRDLADALAAVASPALGAALTSLAEHPGPAVIELVLSCDGTGPRVISHARDGVSVPICVRYEGGARPACALAGDRTELSLSTSRCPTWIDGNAGGTGAYRVVYTDAPVGALATATPREVQALAVDVLAGLDAPTPAVRPAVQLLHALAARGQPHATHAALAIARSLDPLVADEDRSAWTAWLARELRAAFADPAVLVPHLPPAMLPSRPARDAAIADALLALVPGHTSAAAARRARAVLDRLLGPGRGARAGASEQLASVIAIAAHGDRPRFERAVAFARATRHATIIAAGQEGRAAELLALEASRWSDIAPATRDARAVMLADAVLANLDAFGSAFAPALAELAVDPRMPPTLISASLARLLARPGSAAMTWRALAPHLPALVARLAPTDASALLDATQALCDARVRAEVGTAFSPLLAKIDEGQATLDRALAAIDRCIARRAAAGSIVQALALP